MIDCLFSFSLDMDAYNLLRSMAHNECLPEVVTAYIGDGQQERVADLLHSAMKTGSWILIENCNIASCWLEKLLNERFV